MRRHRELVLHVLKHAIFLAVLVCCAVGGLAGCARAPEEDGAARVEQGTAEGPTTVLTADFRNTDVGTGWVHVGSMDLSYATCFSLDYYKGGYVLACMADGNRYLVVPQDAEVPEGLSPDIIVLHKPIEDVYLVASDSMCLFDALGVLDRISVSGIARDDWYVPAARAAMDDGSIVYGGKYRTPDYELLLSRGVRLALESSMINHTPDVREKLMELGIPVLVELSSYESEPLGRAEWIKLYGMLCDCDDRAREVFDEQVERVGSIDAGPVDKTVAYFYLNANGSAVVRRPGDYVTKMIEQAGGTYAFEGLDAAAAGSSSVTLEMEQFYATARDADVLVYNATIDEGVDSLDALLEKNELLADFKAVQNGDVWVTEQDMYQQMIATGDIIADFNRVLHGSQDKLTYLRRLT